MSGQNQGASMTDLTKPLDVRTRRVVGPRQQMYQATVPCPPRRASIPLADCLACGDCVGAMHSADGTQIHCAHPEAQRETLLCLMRQPLFSSAADCTPLSDVMSGDVVCVLPDLGLVELTELLLELNIGGAPVVDDDCRPLGVVSRTDILGAPRQDVTVADIMMPMAFTLPESASLSRAAALMAFEGVHRIPVVSNQGHVVGIVSSLDVSRWLARNDGYAGPLSSETEW
jgi:CBS domain-containing protein